MKPSSVNLIKLRLEYFILPTLVKDSDGKALRTVVGLHVLLSIAHAALSLCVRSTRSNPSEDLRTGVKNEHVAGLQLVLRDITVGSNILQIKAAIGIRQAEQFLAIEGWSIVSA